MSSPEPAKPVPYQKTEELIFGHSLEQIEAMTPEELIKAFAPQILAEPPLQTKPASEPEPEDEEMADCPIKKRAKKPSKQQALIDLALTVKAGEDLS